MKAIDDIEFVSRVRQSNLVTDVDYQPKAKEDTHYVRQLVMRALGGTLWTLFANNLIALQSRHQNHIELLSGNEGAECYGDITWGEVSLLLFLL